jgi:ATP-dependent DNA ligase
VIYAELLRNACDMCSGAQCSHAKALVMRLLQDDGWCWQEKHNGDRRLVEKTTAYDGTVLIVDYNRKGERGKGLSPEIIAVLKAHPLPQFVIDCEFIAKGIHKNTLHIFDALHLGEYNLVNHPYRSRLEFMYSMFNGIHPLIQPVETAFTPAQKLALYERLQAEFAEGFVMKELDARYRESNSTGTLRFNYKYKFVKTLDAVVIGDSMERDDKGMLKNSVRLGLYQPNGMLKDICGATKKSSFVLKPGDVIEIAYLCGTLEQDVVEPRIIGRGPRDDKKAKECTIDQIIVNKNWRKRGA